MDKAALLQKLRDIDVNPSPISDDELGRLVNDALRLPAYPVPDEFERMVILGVVARLRLAPAKPGNRDDT